MGSWFAIDVFPRVLVPVAKRLADVLYLYYTHSHLIHCVSVVQDGGHAFRGDIAGCRWNLLLAPGGRQPIARSGLAAQRTQPSLASSHTLVSVLHGMGSDRAVVGIGCHLLCLHLARATEFPFILCGCAAADNMSVCALKRGSLVSIKAPSTSA